MSTEKILEIGLLTLLTAGFMSLGVAEVLNFTTCGSEGRTGPSNSMCEGSYGVEGPTVEVIGEGVQRWEVPETDTYRITSHGAQGRDDTYGGEGAVMSGEIELEQGDKLRILVGQRHDESGLSAACSESRPGIMIGGGGTFVVKETDDGETMPDGQPVKPLVISGGGGGAFVEEGRQRANTGTSGRDGIDGCYNGPCEGGQNGEASTDYSTSTGSTAGGGGYLSDGEREGGYGFTTNWGLGGVNDGSSSPSDNQLDGAFGGSAGATGNDCDFGGGSGGGGYSGGGHGSYSDGSSASEDSFAGGGGSFIHASMEDAATSDGTFTTTESEPQKTYEGEVENLEEWNTGSGYVTIETPGARDFCNFRGPVNECVMNETNQLQEQEYNVSSVFESRSNAVLEAFDGPATLSLENTTRISGLWRGQISIESEQPRLEAGAEFRPEGERIVIGN